MKLTTAFEREAANVKLHAEAERLRSLMTSEQLAKLRREPHQGARKRARRLKRLANKLK